jgi:acetoin utilization deacetylase AcuC-like enzyme
MQTAYISHPLCLKHDMGAHHPESPARMHAIEDMLIASGLLSYLQHHDAPAATREQLMRVHTPGYIDSIESSVPAQGFVHIDADTAMNPFSYQAALRAAGAVVLGVDLVMGNKVENAFCNIRPPGHHAERARSMGFCIFNNVAVGAAHAMAQHGLQRVAIADFDVHHGNGTEEIFHDDPRVMRMLEQIAATNISSTHRFLPEREEKNFVPPSRSIGCPRWNASSLNCC